MEDIKINTFVLTNMGYYSKLFVMLKYKEFIKYKSIIIRYLTLFSIVIIFITPLSFYFLNQENQLKDQITKHILNENSLKGKLQKLEKQFAELDKQYKDLKNEDQYVINQKNKKEIENIQKTYKKAVSTYEKLLDFKEVSKKTDKLEEQFAKSLSLLSQTNYASSDAILNQIAKEIDTERSKLAASFTIPENLQSFKTPPNAGYRRQKVDLDGGSFMVDIISADLNSTRVIVDTASDGTCTNDCPVLPLAEYVKRSGAYAGVTGSYFCAASYPKCAGKTNSFDMLVMNKNKVYFNSDNNVYSVLPAAIFYGNTARFVERSLEWGRDTSADAVIANFPLMVFNRQVRFDKDGDPKKDNKSSRPFIAATGSTVYIGVVFNATIGEAARVLQSMGIEHAINMDGGGSTALWYQGYKVGPGRNLPNAILFVRK